MLRPMPLRRTVIGGMWGILATFAAAYADTPTIEDAAQQLKKDAECMFGVLLTVPSIDQTKLGVSSDQNWVHPYLEYRAVADESGYRQIVRFGTTRTCAADNHGNCCSTKDRNYCFTAILSGLSAPGKVPNDWGTSGIERKWKSACGVTAFTLFE